MAEKISPRIGTRFTHACDVLAGTPQIDWLWAIGLWTLIILFVYLVVPDVISRDQWSFVPLIKDAYNGQLTFHDLWRSHSEHVKPGYKLLFVANALYFHLNMKLEIYTGLLALLFITRLLQFEFRRSQIQTAPALATVLGSIAIASLTLSFNQVAAFRFSLLALGGFVGTGLTVSAWVLADRARLSGRGSNLLLAGSCIALLLDIFGFSGARAPAVVASLVIALGLSTYLTQGDDRKLHIKTLLFTGFVGTASLAAYLVLIRDPGEASGVHGALFIAFTHPWKLTNYLALGTLSSIINVQQLLQFQHVAMSRLILAGYLVLGSFAYAVVAYFRHRMWQRSLLPLIAIFYTVGILGETFLGRYSLFGLANAASPRYVLDLIPGAIGVSWILSATLAQPRKDAASRAVVSITVLMLAGILTTQIWNGYVVAQFAHYERNAGVRAIQLVRDGDFDRPSWVCPHPDLCRSGRDILIKYRLNVFRQDEPLAK